ncbi:MAG: S41 family peptidase [bacterium]|nr:S41 family peptidase [bacterium]
MKAKFNLWMFVSFFLGAILLFGTKNVSDVVANEKGPDLDQLKLFADVISIVQRDYVETVSTKKLVEGAVKGMLTTLDPHSAFLTSDYYKELQVETTGEFGGLGIEITVKDGLLIVVAPIEGSPAERSGIKPGDAIIKIEGKFTKNLSLLDAVRQMRGQKGEPISISVLRKGAADLIDVTIIRDVIKVKSVKSRYLENGFGYLRLSQFQENSGNEVKLALDKIKKKASNGELSGLILDLRNNPGGLLTQAIQVSDLFLQEGVIVYTDGRVEDQKKKFFAHARGTEVDYPLVVLVNEGSASASEIVAGALKDHGRALIIGSRTFGKGSVQTVLPLYSGAALRLTTALYYTKSGRSIQATGIEPDIEVKEEEKKELPALDGERVRESDLPGAIENPSGRKIDKNKNPKKGMVATELPVAKDIETMDLTEFLTSDYVLKRALEILKTYNIFKNKEPVTLQSQGAI